MSPPSFQEAKNKRQKARAAGLDPNHWYAAEQDHALGTGSVVAVQFWGAQVAVYRDDRGIVHAIEDRCAHRQLPLSKGVVKGDRLVGTYHLWGDETHGAPAKPP